MQTIEGLLALAKARENIVAKTDSSVKRRASEADMAIVARIVNGDKSAFSALVKAHFQAMKRLSMCYVADSATAEEMVQETWLAALSGIAKFEGRSSLKSWIYSILVNKSKTRGQKDKRNLPFSSFESENEPAVDSERFNAIGMWRDPVEPWSETSAETQILQKEAREFLLSAIDLLEAKQRMVVTLRDIEGLQAKEVCNILEIGETYERVLLHRARSNLRGKLEIFMKER